MCGYTYLGIFVKIYPRNLLFCLFFFLILQLFSTSNDILFVGWKLITVLVCNAIDSLDNKFEMIKVTTIVFRGGGQKKGFHPGPTMWVSSFGLRIAGPHNFPCCVGLVLLSFQNIGFPIFSQISLNSVDFHPFYRHFPSFLYYVPQFWQSLCLTLLY